MTRRKAARMEPFWEKAPLYDIGLEMNVHWTVAFCGLTTSAPSQLHPQTRRKPPGIR